MSTLTTYVAYLLALSKEEQQEQTGSSRTRAVTVEAAQAAPREPPQTPQIKDPANFLQAFLRVLDKQEKTTRRGVDAAIEALFGIPDMEPLLDDVTAVTFQRHFVVNHFPLCSPLFRNYWSHVITAAWDQLRDVRRMMNYTNTDPHQ
jgi:hypothetical protein